MRIPGILRNLKIYFDGSLTQACIREQQQDQINRLQTLNKRKSAKKTKRLANIGGVLTLIYAYRRRKRAFFFPREMDIRKLPPELRRMIYNHLDQPSHRSLSLTSRLFYQDITQLRFCNERYKTFLEWAYSGNASMLEAYAGGLKPPYFYQNLSTAMSIAAAEGNRQFLVSLNVSLSANQWGFQPCLNSAVLHDQRDVVQYLLHEGADPEHPWKEWPTDLAKDSYIRRMLIKKGRRFTLEKEFKRAIEAGSLRDIRKLSQHHFLSTDEGRRSLGPSLVGVAARYREPYIIDMLLSIGCSTNPGAFIRAISAGEFEIAAALRCNLVLDHLPDAKYREGDMKYERCVRRLKIFEGFIAWKKQNMKHAHCPKTSVHFRFSCCRHRGARRSPRLIRTWICQTCCNHRREKR